jgi:hypothetical protein
MSLYPPPLHPLPRPKPISDAVNSFGLGRGYLYRPYHVSPALDSFPTRFPSRLYFQSPRVNIYLP